MSQNTTHWASIQQLLIEMTELQKKRLQQCAEAIIPNITPDDILQPNDFYELEQHPIFRYEEGILAGIQSVQMALNALKNSE